MVMFSASSRNRPKPFGLQAASFSSQPAKTHHTSALEDGCQGASSMSYRRLCIVLVALLLSACGQAISVSPPKAIAIPTAAIAHQAGNVTPPTPNHRLIDTAI